ncbi:hypothetical protein [Burkholderia gladioli]|uniref:hypothetical protein n=1 Tax=Burkholderia gladioli TaxID=28095 RepID=UPI001C5DFF00|nr:hypothetical protein [Burkholderia gladioli]MBW5286751.1 hypothetical protein [Burkholderia gladioli]
MSDDITPVNYCTHAIEDLRETAKKARMRGFTMMAKRLETVIEMLSTAQKFLLPNCGELIDTESVRETHLDLLRLPYPVTAFEAPWRKEEAVLNATLGGVPESLSTRRIALCWEMTEDHVPVRGLREIVAFREAYPTGGVFIYPIFYADQQKIWNAGIGGIFVPREFRIPEGRSPTRMTQMIREAKESAGRVHRNAIEHIAEPFVLFEDTFEAVVAQSHGDVDTAFARLAYDACDEVHMVIQACAVLNCTNVGTIDVHPKPALNARRLATRRQPFFTYKVLQLAPGKLTGGAKKGGSHSAPRAHLRRGHIRRLEGRVTWVRPAVVNAGSERGVVAKDYRIGDRHSADKE